MTRAPETERSWGVARRRPRSSLRSQSVTITAAPSAIQLFGGAGSWPCDESFEAMWPEAESIEGWLAKAQARVLFRAASLVPDGQVIVEIGSHKGRSTVFLATGKRPATRLLAVDPFDDPRWGGGPEALADFHATLDRFGLAGTVETYRGVSAEASVDWTGEPIGLLFVDGAHDRASVLADIDGWEGFVADGGIVVFHDAFSSIGTTEALTLRHLASRRFRYLGAERTLVAFVREDLGLGSALASGAAMAGRYRYFGRNLAVKVLLRQGRPELARRWLRYRDGDDLY